MLLKYYRNKLNLTQKELAEKLNVSHRYYQNIEAGISFPRRNVSYALEDLFELPQRVLLSENIEEVPKYLRHYTKNYNT